MRLGLVQRFGVLKGVFLGDITLTAKHFSEKDVSSFVCRLCLGCLNLAKKTRIRLIYTGIHEQLSEDFQICNDILVCKFKIIYLDIVKEIIFFLWEIISAQIGR